MFNALFNHKPAGVVAVLGLSLASLGGLAVSAPQAQAIPFTGHVGGHVGGANAAPGPGDGGGTIVTPGWCQAEQPYGSSGLNLGGILAFTRTRPMDMDSTQESAFRTCVLDAFNRDVVILGARASGSKGEQISGAVYALDQLTRLGMFSSEGARAQFRGLNDLDRSENDRYRIAVALFDYVDGLLAAQAGVSPRTDEELVVATSAITPTPVAQTAQEAVTPAPTAPVQAATPAQSSSPEASASGDLWIALDGGYVSFSLPEGETPQRVWVNGQHEVTQFDTLDGGFGFSVPGGELTQMSSIQMSSGGWAPQWEYITTGLQTSDTPGSEGFRPQ